MQILTTAAGRGLGSQRAGCESPTRSVPPREQAGPPLKTKVNNLASYPRACICAQSFSSVPCFVTPWTAARQAPLSTKFSRQEYWNGLPVPPPVDLCGPGMEPTFPVAPALAGRLFTAEPPGKPKLSIQLPYNL